MTLTALLPLADPTGADSARPGWIPFFIVLALGAFVAFLYFSMKKQLGKIDLPEDSTDDSPDGPADEATPPGSPVA